MNKYRLNIDGKEVYGLPGQTILEVCKENDIFIPTLCYDERTEIYGACGLCMVEMEGNPKLWKACATEIAPNMISIPIPNVYLNPEKQIWNFFFPTTKVTVVHHVCRHVRQEQTARVM